MQFYPQSQLLLCLIVFCLAWAEPDMMSDNLPMLANISGDTDTTGSP